MNLRVCAVAAALCLSAACGGSETVESTTTGDPISGADRTALVVEAADVDVVGDLTDDQAAMVDWALARFQEAGLHLPSEIEVMFDTNAEFCNLRLGTCHPPNGAAAVSVCRKGPATSAIVLANRLTLLHELAHLWHWTEGDGTGWPDDSAIVGGEFSCEGTPWEDESIERVAETITWGLYNELRRPVRTDFTCAELYVQFEQLTGSEPLGPLEGICLPDGSD